MNDDGDAEPGYARYVVELHRELESLERFPRSSYTQALILAVSVPVLVAAFFGFSPLPVPAYILLPFVGFPGWTLLQRERAWRVGHRRIREQIQLIEYRRHSG